MTRKEFNRDCAYAAWRFDMWLSGNRWTYNDIDKMVAAGELTPGTCPNKGCKCRWKHGESAE